MEEIKTKMIGACSYNEKVMFLTLKPKSWTIKQADGYFDTSEYLVKRAIKQKKGILSKPIISGRNKIPDEEKVVV